ncbi:MAG: hypothetical protein V1647_02145 [Pseudomonadota bacterium]
MFVYLLSLVLSLNIQAKPFANNFVEMNVPDDWNCAVYSGDQWTCQPKDVTKTKDALVVMSFVSSGPQDSLQAYHEYLNTSLIVIDPATKKKVKSTPKNIQYKDIVGQTWVDSQHLSIALPNYFTRFLATTKDGRSVLVSVTVDKAKYSLYMSELYKMIESMRLRASSPAAPMETGLMGIIGTKIKGTDKKEQKVVTAVPVEQKRSKLRIIISLAVGLIVFVLAYRYLRKKYREKAGRKSGKFFK